MLSFTFRYLIEFKVCLEAALLKPSMINAGSDSYVQSPADEVAKYALQTVLCGVSRAMPGIHFQPGGMSNQESTENLKILNIMQREISLESQVQLRQGAPDVRPQIMARQPR